MPDPWSKLEVNLIVADYFEMLIKEINGVPYNKADHRRRILPLLQNRSNGSIEFKHQNISAILIRNGRPYISGYLPRYNYQTLLEEVVLGYLLKESKVETNFKEFAEKDIAQPPTMPDFNRIIVPPPKMLPTSEPDFHYTGDPVKINYLEKEQSNRTLGNYGENLVIEYEKWNLIKIGKGNLADRIEWVSKDIGDGAGFDILSKNPNGTDKYIEVKTTRLGKETPFFYSANELKFSIRKAEFYYLYRLFNVERDAKLFQKSGALNTICNSIPIMYKGYF